MSRTLKSLEIDNKKVQVESAICDGDGNNIVSTYVKKYDSTASWGSTDTKLAKVSQTGKYSDLSLKPHIYKHTVVCIANASDILGSSYSGTIRLTLDYYLPNSSPFGSFIVTPTSPTAMIVPSMNIPAVVYWNYTHLGSTFTGYQAATVYRIEVWEQAVSQGGAVIKFMRVKPYFNTTDNAYHAKAFTYSSRNSSKRTLI